MFCPACGTSIPAQSRFCIGCGQPVPAVAVPALPYAEFGPRFAARIIDMLVLLPIGLPWIGLVAWFVLQLPEKGSHLEEPMRVIVPFVVGGVFLLLLTIAATWLYHAMLESGERQGTIGKRVMGLIVTDVKGNRISFARASGRWVCGVLITSQTMLIGYLMMLFTEKKQTLHDLLAETVVLSGKAGDPPSGDRVLNL
ncbi:MAG: RDD family protein [Bryobacteraceae bacterium]